MGLEGLPLNEEGNDVVPSQYRWVILLLIWLGYFGFGLISSSMPPLATQITSDLGLSSTQMGVILGTWILLYAPLAICLGLLIDLIKTKKLIFIGLVLIALSGFLRAFAINFETMTLFVAIFGIGGPIISIGMAKTLALWFVGKERGTVAGIYLTGFFVGSGTVLAVTNSIIIPLLGNWRNALVLYGLLGFVFAALWLLFCREATHTRVEEPLLRSLKAGVIKLLSEKHVWLVGLSAFLFFIVSYGYNSWIPTLLETKGMTEAEAGIFASLINWFGIIGSIFIPRLGKTGTRRRLLFILILIIGVLVYSSALVTSLPLYTSLILYGIISAAIGPLAIVLLIELPNIGAKYTGAATGLLFSFGAVGGFIGPLMVGYFIDLTGTLLLGFILLAVICEAILIINLFIREQ